jgi:hypothetical protein
MEDTVLALKKKFGGDEEKAFATAWAIYNKKHKKENTVSADLQVTPAVVDYRHKDSTVVEDEWIKGVSKYAPDSSLKERKELDNLIRIQKDSVVIDGKVDDYMHGLLNGLICANAVIDSQGANYPDRESFTEAKSTLTLKNLVSSTKSVNNEFAVTANRNQLNTLNVDTEESAYMKMIRFMATVDGFRPVIAFFDYNPTVKQEAGNSWTAGLTGGTWLADKDSHVDTVVKVDSNTNPVRVSCTCDHYLVYFSSANSSVDAHHGMRPKQIDARDYGFKKSPPNPKQLPGMCEHLLELADYLINLDKSVK